MVNYHAAQLYCLTIKESATRDLVDYCLTRMIVRMAAGERPEEGFDAMFFVKTIEDAISQHVQDGGTFSWEDAPDDGDASFRYPFI